MLLDGQEPALVAGFAAQCVRSERRSLYAPQSLRSLASFALHQATVVDIACRDARGDGGCYSGEERARQSVELKFGDFVDFYCAAHAGAAHWLGDVDDLEFYLCQCPIAVLRPDATCAAPALPHVMDDFVIPAALASEALSQVNLWMAVRASRTGLHYDAYRNILVVLHGRKNVTLYAPSEIGGLYAHPVHSKSANHSRVNVSSPDLEAHPRFASAKSHKIAVNAGDALFIPEGWWHQVDTDAFTIAVNFWFDGLQKQLATEIPDAMVPYCLRVLLQGELKRGAERCFRAMRASAAEMVRGRGVKLQGRDSDSEMLVQCFRDAPLHHDRELIVIAASAESSNVFQSVQRKLVTRHPSEWGELLENASDELVAVLTESWERDPTPTADDGDSCESKEQFVATLFGAFSSEDSDRIRARLLDKKCEFEKKICAQVVGDTLGLRVLL